jgi:hypothetical protein
VSRMRACPGENDGVERVPEMGWGAPPERCWRWGDDGLRKSAEVGEGEQVPGMGSAGSLYAASMRRREMSVPRPGHRHIVLGPCGGCG